MVVHILEDYLSPVHWLQACSLNPELEKAADITTKRITEAKWLFKAIEQPSDFTYQLWSVYFLLVPRLPVTVILSLTHGGRYHSNHRCKTKIAL